MDETTALVLGLLWSLFFFGGLFCLYFAPAIIAGWRHHHQAASITVLNLLLGWTILGWIIALIWAFSAVDEARVERLKAEKSERFAADQQARVEAARASDPPPLRDTWRRFFADRGSGKR